MKRLLIIFLLILFVLPGCQRKQVIEIKAPTAPPSPVDMQPTGPPPSVN
jgi:hypothetical protein